MLKIGATIQLEVGDEDRVEKFRCKLVERKGNKLYIDYPINERTGKTGILLDGTQLKATFLGQGDVVFIFTTEVIGRKKDIIPMMILQYPGDDHLIRIQRRQFVRIDAAVDCAVHPINNKSDFSPFTTLTTDISGGGAAIILPNNHPLKEGEEILCWLAFHLTGGDYHYLKVNSSITRIIDGENEHRDKASIKFEDIGEKDREIIIRYCFEKQLALRKQKG